MALVFKSISIIPSPGAKNRIIVESRNEVDSVMVEYDGSLNCVFQAITKFKYETAGKHGLNFYLKIHPEIIEIEKSRLNLINYLQYQ